MQYGVSTKTLTASQLGFSKTGKSFAGWKAYREIDDTWFVTDKNGKTSWTKLANGKLPSGSSFYIYKNGSAVAKTAPSGNVHFYAQWKDSVFTVKYHADDAANASSKTTKVQYGVSTKTLTTSELGFSKTGQIFVGWKAYREVDDKWFVVGSDGKAAWTKLANGELPEGSSFYIYQNGNAVSKTAPSGNVHFYAQWIGDTIDVSDFGANGSDEFSDWTAIQKSLNFGKNNDNHIKVIVGAGRYYIDKTLTVYSNTELILDENAEIIRMDQSKTMLKSESDSKTGGYGQAHNITVKGGKWNGNITNLAELSSGLLTFHHAQGITLEDFEISQCSTRHMVTFDGAKDVIVRNVSFADQFAYTGEDEGADNYVYHIEYRTDKTHNPDNSFKNMEALHIDFISEDGTNSGALPLDGTSCENILVENCSFNNVFSGVGSHYGDNTMLRSNNIIIRNNSFKDVKYIAMHVCQYDNAKVYDNMAEDVGELLRINKSSGEVYNNTATIKNSLIGSPKDARFYGIWVYQGTSLTSLENNSISGALDNGISVIEGSNVENLKNNTLINSGNHGIWISDSTVNNIVSNNLEGVSKTAIYVYNNASASKIEDNSLSESGDYGIVINQANAGVIKNNSIDTTGNTGILISSGVASLKNNIISNTNGHGISILKSTCEEVSKNTINNVIGDAKHGIILSGSTVSVISENNLADITQDGIHINITSGIGSTVSNINNNIINRVGRKGIGVNKSSVDNITENYIDTTGEDGMSILESTASIENNQIKNVSGQGIYLKLSNCGKVNNNVISDATADNKNGILSGGSTVTEMNGNDISNLNKDGININSSGGIVSTISELRNNTIKNPGRKGIGIYYESVVLLNENNSVL